MDVFFIKLNILNFIKIKKAFIEPRIRKELSKPFFLGEIKNINFKGQTISFMVTKVATAFVTFEFFENGFIKYTDKINKEINVLDEAVQFKECGLTKYAPYLDVSNGKKILGFDHIERTLIPILNHNGLRVIAIYGLSGYGKKSFLRQVEKNWHEKHFIWADKFEIARNENFFYDQLFILDTYRTDIVICVPDADKLPAEDISNLTKFIRYCQENCKSKKLEVKIIITSEYENMSEGGLQRFIKYVFHIQCLSLADKTTLLRQFMCDHGSPDWESEAVTECASSLHGYTPADMLAIVTKVATDGPVTITRLIDCHTRRLCVPDRLSFYDQVMPLHFTEIGGYEAVKVAMRQAVMEPLGPKGIPARGILMHGPPGCSKTLFARAIATESRRNMFIVRSTDVLKPLVGDSDRALKKILMDACSAAPSIVFIDEIDKVIPARTSGGNTSVGMRLLSMLLKFLDGAGAGKHDVLLLGATNHLENVDAALRRPGRMRPMEVGLPDLESRAAILAMALASVKCRVSEEVLAGVTEVATAMEGLCGADIVGAAKEMCLRGCKEGGTVTMAHVEDILARGQ